MFIAVQCPLQQYFSYTDKYIDGGNQRTAKPADVVTPVKQSPVFKGHTIFCPVVVNLYELNLF